MNKQEQEEEKLIIPAPVLLITDATVDTDTDGQVLHVSFFLTTHNKKIETMHLY